MEVKESEITRRNDNYYWKELEKALEQLDEMSQKEKSEYVAEMTGGEENEPELAYSVMCSDFRIPVDKMSRFRVLDEEGNIIEEKLNYVSLGL